MKLNEIHYPVYGEARAADAKKAKDLLLQILSILLDEGCTTNGDIYELSVSRGSINQPGPVIELRLMAEEPGDLQELELLHRVVAKRLGREVPQVTPEVKILGDGDDGGAVIELTVDPRGILYSDLKHQIDTLNSELFRRKEAAPLADTLETYRAHSD